MEDFDDDYMNLLENMLSQTEDIDSLEWDDSFSTYYSSSSPDEAASSMAAKNIISERNRRKKLNDRLFALRAVVPKISKMDKASIIKDAIEYIQELHEQERLIQLEISELESGRSKIIPNSYIDEELGVPLRIKKKKRVIDRYSDSNGCRSSSIEGLDIRMSYVGEKTLVISITCNRKTDTMVKLCEVFESLNLKIVTANITAFSGRLLNTVFIEADEEEKEQLKEKIQSAIAAVAQDPYSPMSA
ncbi:hypothetical protein Scep_023208 [Stephania cephalantha]|uniref:BHLH domain-containing protein n=1 Tax=Stephania cephalantha TaxID=152367 RepID=A0AAP0HSK6_9MAGN